MKAISEKTGVFVGSGNVFADLGLPNPEECQLKAYLIMEIENIIKDNGLTKTQAAKKLGLSQHDLSELLEGALADFSISQLVGHLHCLGRDVTLSATVSERVPEKAQEVKEREMAVA